MRRLWMLLTIGVLLLASPAMAAITYSAFITVTNSGATSYSSLGVAISMNNSYLAAQSYTITNGTDVQILLNGASLPRMLTTNTTYVALPVNANSSYNLNYTTGNAPTDFAIVPGYGGYVTINDTASMEPSTNFTLDINGYVDTSVSANVVGKSGALALQTRSGNVTATIFYGGTPTIYPLISSNSTGIGTASNNALVTMPLGITSGGELIVIINAYAAAAPTLTTPTGWTQLIQGSYYAGEDLGVWYKVATGSETTTIFPSSQASTDYAYQCFYIVPNTYQGIPAISTMATGNSANPAPPALTTGFGNVMTMFMVLNGNNAIGSSAAPANYGALISNNDTVHSGIGTAERYLTATADTPGTFTNYSSNIWGAITIGVEGNSALSVSAAVASGEHDIKVIEDSSHLWMTSDGVAITANVTAVAVPDTSANWTIGGISYINSFKEYVGGNLKCWYQPNTMILGTALPDRSGNGNTGTLVYGTNPANISASIGSLTSYSGAAVATTTPPIPQVVTGLTSSGAAGSNPVNVNFPLYGLFHMMAVTLQVSDIIMINIGFIFFITAVGIACLVGRLGPIFTGILEMFIYGLSLVAYVGDWWMIFMAFSFIVMSWMIPRQTVVI